MRIGEKFAELRRRREGAYMPHIYYGDPNEKFSMELLKALSDVADLMEIGIPFSDPIADGPTFIAACERALKAGITPRKCMDAIRELRRDSEIPIVVTTYYNIPYKFGVEKFVRSVRECGADGLIIPDLPIEEAGEMLEIARRNGIDLILQVAPTTSDVRMKRIVENASGFLYVISVEGVTGTRDQLWNSTIELIRRVRRRTDLPIIAGFGISRREHAERIVAEGADGVVTGSAIAEIYARDITSPQSTLEDVLRFAREIKSGCVDGYRKRII